MNLHITDYMLVLAICCGVIAQIGFIVYAVKNWKNPDVDSVNMILSLMFGGFAAAMFSPVLIPVAIIGIPVWIFTKLRKRNIN